MTKLFRSLALAYGALRQGGKVALFVCATAPAFADGITIAALGDSLTQGFGLVPEQGFVPQMQAWLDARGHDVALINAGVSGDTTAGGLARVDWTLTPEVDAMIVALGGNDFLRGIDPDVSRANLAGILEVAARTDVEVLLVGITASGNYGPEFQEAFNSMYPALAQQYGTLLVENFFDGLSGTPESDPGDLLDLMQPDGIHPNASGVVVIVDTLGPQVEALIERAQSE